MPNLVANTLTPIAYSGASESYTVTATGVVTFKLWGGAGGGGSDPSSRATGYAGSGGFADGTLSVVTGDIIKLEVGGGGAKGIAAVNAAGGWPDGGGGGVGSVTSYSSGGGGGSTRLYLNNVLYAVAGGGGGGNYGPGGPGGGPIGGTGFSTTIISAPGGTQSAGGSSSANTGNVITNGGSLAGGVSVVNDQYTGGGGGGGYFGGAAGSNAGTNSYRGGGGGSGFIHANVLAPSRNLIGLWRYPAVTAGAPAGIAEGGVTAYSFASNLHTAGGAGYATLELSTPVTLPTGTTTLSFTGARKAYVATAVSSLTGHLWGGAGAGGTYISGGAANRKGGAGGYVSFAVQLAIGDVVRFEVGEGGKPSGYDATLPATSQPVAGGVGGWPDGGIGGRSSTTTHIGFGGGGGSTRLYVNDVLMAIAGAGGGATGLYYGGNGGGTAGLASTDTASGGGGTQTAGGATGTGVTAMAGASLRGGWGVAEQTLPVSTAGAGGGGGYYGGGSNGGAAAAHGSGGGGSGYVRAGNLNSAPIRGAMQVGANNTGTPFDVTGVRNSGIAEGGNGAGPNYTTTTAGGSGQATFTVAALTTLTNGSTTTIAYTGVRAEYTVTAPSYIDLEMWGAGGGGGCYETGGQAGRFGGAGGYTKFRRLISAYDLISFEVGQGGRKPSLTANNGGLGGWPNGGLGGRAAVSTNHMGGGGGATNVYINGVLAGAASAGGGSTGFYHGGNGGGLTGLTSAESTDNGAGGTQSAGGANRGVSMQGGSGGPTGDAVTSDAFAGAGGGGGYYGGGGNRGATGTYGSGGGGSGYSSNANSLTDFQAGTQGTGNPFSNANRPAGVAQGGASNTTVAATTDGGNGVAIVTVTAVTDIPLYLDTPTTVAATGASTQYVVASAGTLSIKLWGAGGGGGTRSSGATPGPGGGGGFVWFDLAVISGDIIKLEVGVSGKGSTSTSAAGAGGWPDGGTAGLVSVGSYGCGGGGGSTRVYLNGTVVGVAAGGGGGGQFTGGSAGGLVGQAGGFGETKGGVLGSTVSGTGATQSAGGVSVVRPTETISRGLSLAGGKGWADSGNNTDTAGGGGGGGYYGGGGGSPTLTGGQMPAGGGGSSYIMASALNQVMRGGTGQYAADSSNTQLGTGGLATTAYPGGNGLNGQAYLNLSAVSSLVSTTPTTLSATGASRYFTAPSAGHITVKMWGGGGGGGVCNSSGEAGGCAGYTTVKHWLNAGDKVRLDVASGGQGGQWTSGTISTIVGAGGNGGWPDGGPGGIAAVASSGGGGGSSRLWVNGLLVALAGGAGGGGVGASTRRPGAGGGLAGQDGIDTVTGTTRGLGGKSEIGGYNPYYITDLQMQGANLQGASGFGFGTSGQTTYTQSSGGGGGGGWYGGGGGGGPAGGTDAAGGGGGSSYFGPTCAQGSTTTLAGNQNLTVGGSTDAAYVAGIGVGGTAKIATPVANAGNGGNGSIIYTFIPATVTDTVESSYITLAASGSSTFRRISTTGSLTLKLWGGAGGGSMRSGAGAGKSSGGGYAQLTLPVTVGQILRFDVGKGGQGGQYTSGTSPTLVGTGGSGGFPDGGNGGYFTGTSAGGGAIGGVYGGGGGSTSVYLDDVLIAIGGGGGGSGDGTSFSQPGGGGGTAGGNSGDSGLGQSTGGSQSAGGVNGSRSTDLVTAGSALRGGNGYNTAANSRSVSTATAGGGGGGGWYGGGGGGYTSSHLPWGGGGGSGYGWTGAGPLTSDPYRAYVVGQFSFNNAIVEDLGRMSVTLNGTGQSIVTTSPHSGQGMLLLNGSGHVNGVLPAALADNHFTIEGWYKCNTLPASGVAQTLFATGNNGTGGVALFFNGNGANYDLYIRFNNSPSANVNTFILASTPLDTAWHHYAMVRDDDSLRIYKDGILLWTILQTTMTTAGTTSNQTTTLFQIGSYTQATSSPWVGNIDDVRVTPFVCRYKATFTPPTFGGLNVTGVVLTTATTGDAVAAQTGLAANNADANYPPNAGLGVSSTGSSASASSGNDGAAVYKLDTPTTTATGPIGTINVTAPTGTGGAIYALPAPGATAVAPYEGENRIYIASVLTQLKIEMWGAGGGGLSASNLGGGSGGYTTYEVTLQAGDSMTVTVPSGGGGGANAGSPAGAAGYPDGGTGFAPASTTFKGGGGGSARVSINGLLAAVAGGGGGGSYGSVAADYAGGAGGGSSGVTAPTNGGGGGTQSAGGAGFGNGLAGTSTKGGNGGTTSGLAGNGPGGGGGYYGGGGGDFGGGGGSGYVNTGLTGFITGTTTAGSGNQPAGTSSPNWSAGIGVGSTGGGNPGGSGRVTIYNNTPTPGNASGVSGGTVVVTPPVGGVDSPPLGAISIGTVNVTPPVGQTGIGGNAIGTLPTVTLSTPITQAQAQVVVTVPINNSTSVLITAPEVEPFSLDANVNALLSTVTVLAPVGRGEVPQSPVSPAEGDIGTVVVSAPEGMGSSGLETIVPIDVTITVTPAVAAGLGDGTNATLKTGKFNDIRLTEPGGNALVTGAADGSASLSMALPTIPVVAPEAEFILIDYLVDGLPSPIVFTVTPPVAAPTGAVFMVPEPYKDNGNPSNWYYGKVTLSPPDATLATAVNMVTFQELPIIVGGLAADVDLSADVNVAMPAPIIINGGDGEPSMDISPPIDAVIYLTPPTATADGGTAVILDEPLPGPIIVTAPDGSVPNMGVGDIGTIFVQPATGEARVPILQDNILPLIDVDGPEGTAVGGIGIDISGTLPTVSVFAPQAGNVSGAAVSIPLLTLFITPPSSTAQAGVAISAAPSVVNIVAPQGRGEVPAAATGALSVITVITPQGVGYEYMDAATSGDIGTITVTPAVAVATGAVAKDNILPTIVVTPVIGRGEVPAATTGNLPVITIEPVEGVATTDTVHAEGDLPTIVVTPADGAATGQGTGNVTLPTIIVTGPEMTFEAGVDLATPIDLTIQLVPPEGLGYPVIPAAASGDLPSVLVTATNGTATGSVLIQQPIGVIPVSPPVADPSGAVNLITFQELPIILAPPVGEFYREASVVLGMPTIYVYTPNATVQGDDSTAAVSGDLPVIYIETPDGYAEVPVVDGTARIRFRRSLTAAAVPASLEEREIAFNEADGIMYSRDGSGALRPTPWRSLTKDRIPAAIGSNGQVLRADGSWGAPAPVYTMSVQTLPAASARVPLAEAIVGQATLTPSAGILLYSPFFVPRTMAITALSVDVVTADSGTALAGICEWSLNRSPGATLIQGTTATTATGVRTVGGTAISLEPGWYAAMFRYLGAGAPTFRTATGPNQVAADFTTIQGAPAYVSAAL